MDFYDRVKALVKSNTDKTLRSFIEELGINYDSYNGQKRYNNLPRADEAVKIAKALNTSVEYLVTGNDNVINIEETRKKIEAMCNDFIAVAQKYQSGELKLFQ